MNYHAVWKRVLSTIQRLEMWIIVIANTANIVLTITEITHAVLKQIYASKRIQLLLLSAEASAKRNRLTSDLYNYALQINWTEMLGLPLSTSVRGCYDVRIVKSQKSRPHKIKSNSHTQAKFPSQCPSGTILLTPHSMVWDWPVSRAGPMLFYGPKMLYYSLLLFSLFSPFCL